MPETEAQQIMCAYSHNSGEEIERNLNDAGYVVVKMDEYPGNLWLSGYNTALREAAGMAERYSHISGDLARQKIMGMMREFGPDGNLRCAWDEAREPLD